MAKKCHKISRISIALFAQSQSQILLLLLHFSIFLLEISFSTTFGSFFIVGIFEFWIWRHFSAISRKMVLKYWYLAKLQAKKSLNIPIIPCMGILFFGHNSAIFWPIGWSFLWKLRKLISIDCKYKINVMAINFRFQFLGPFLAGKWAWPPRRRIRVWGLETRPKSWPTLGSF